MAGMKKKLLRKYTNNFCMKITNLKDRRKNSFFAAIFVSLHCSFDDDDKHMKSRTNQIL